MGSSNSNGADKILKSLKNKDSKSKTGLFFGVPTGKVTSSTVALMRILLIVVAVIVIALGFFAAYRSIGYVAINRMYGCVEDDIDAVNYLNTMVDVDTGMFIEDRERVKAAADEAYGSYADRGCTDGLLGNLASDLAEKQRSVESAAIDYFETVGVMAEEVSTEESTVLLEKYDAFREQVTLFEEAVDEAESRFLLAF